MNRLNLLLALMLVGCALLLVTAQYRSTRLMITVERAQGQARELDVRERQLKIVITERAQESRVDSIARQQLQMIDLTPERVLPAKDLR